MSNRQRSIGKFPSTTFCQRAHEIHRGLPSSDYMSCFPIPPSSAQPPYKPLLAPHPFHTLYDTGLVTASICPHQTDIRSSSVMHPMQSGRYQLTGDGYIFAEDCHNNREGSTWYTIHTSVPLAESTTSSCELRVSGNSPLFNVHHEVQVTLTCAYDGAETPQPLTERLHFSVPLHFVHVTPTSHSRSFSLSLSSTTSDTSSSTSSNEPVPQMLPCSLPYAHSLPAYSQLFDSNGDRQIDYSIPLPVYTPHTPLSSDHSQLDAVGGEGKSVFFVANDSESV
jgi:hypothetical protein